MPKITMRRFSWPIIGHSLITQYLHNQLNTGRLAHAYLFVGPRHVGKTTVSAFFVRSLVCRQLNNHDHQNIPCGDCECCHQVLHQVHPDVYWLDRTTDAFDDKKKHRISIEQIRQLQSRLRLASLMDTYKVAVIEGAELLSLEASNALLKVLEEPSKKTVIILIAHRQTLPPTVVSRCQVVQFLPVSRRAIEEYLLEHGNDKKKAQRLAALATGRPGVALCYANDERAYQAMQLQVKQLLGVPRSDVAARFRIASDIIGGSSIDELEEVLNQWLAVLRDLLFIQLGIGQLAVHPMFTTELSQLARRYSPAYIQSLIESVEQSKHYLRAYVNPKLIFENLLLTF